MEFEIHGKEKRDKFVGLFQQLKQLSDASTLYFTRDGMYLQGMDQSHILLYTTNLSSDWFVAYECENSMRIGINTHIVANVLGFAKENQILAIRCESTDPDVMEIRIASAGQSEKEFSIPLIELEEDLMNITPMEYDAVISFDGRKFCDLFDQLAKFGDEVSIEITPEIFTLSSSGDKGTMKVRMETDELLAFSLVEDVTINASFSLCNIIKCATTKFGRIEISLSTDMPIKIMYFLGNQEADHITFYLAPKVNDEDA